MISNESKAATARQANLTYYDANATTYAERTADANLSHLYESFLSLLPPSARILDVGCGGGRDLKAFRKRGFDALGIDPSSELAAIARRNSGTNVAVAHVENIDFLEEFDAVWACASLLHLPRTELPEALKRIRRSLVTGGVFFLSVQAGSGEGISGDGRYFTYYDEPEIRAAVEATGFEILKKWGTADSLDGRCAIRWVNLLARKSSSI
jgi:SAM-dependent methyltransferase